MNLCELSQKYPLGTRVQRHHRGREGTVRHHSEVNDPCYVNKGYDAVNTAVRYVGDGGDPIDCIAVQWDGHVHVTLAVEGAIRRVTYTQDQLDAAFRRGHAAAKDAMLKAINEITP